MRSVSVEPWVADPVSSIQGTAGDTPPLQSCGWHSRLYSEFLVHHKPLMMDGDEGLSMI